MCSDRTTSSKVATAYIFHKGRGFNLYVNVFLRAKFDLYILALKLENEN